MGSEVEAKCLDCGKTFTVKDGGGFFFHLVRCNKCGKPKSIGFDDLGELHLRYLKGLPAPYSSVSSEHDRIIQKNATIEAISEEEYHRGINAFAGKCGCGGEYTLDAPSRCPKCHSTHIEEGKAILMYD